MTIFLILLILGTGGAPAPVAEHEEIKGKLIYPGSSDTFENRKTVKDMLGALNIRTQKLHRAGQGGGPAPALPKMPDLGPKNNFSAPSLSQTNKDILDWMYEADIALTPSQASAIVTGLQGGEDAASRSKRSLQTDPAGFWNPLNPINYTFDSSLTSDVVALIRQGVQYWAANTCMSFRENPSGNNRLRFYAGVGCWGYVGKQPTWPSQDISIGDGCNNLGTVTHEIGHALGFYHTQSRYDRDNWIHVDMGNVDPNLQYNFAKMTPATENHFGQPYDYGSVMQYNAYAFAVDPNQPTVIALNPAYQNSMGQREAPAFSDVRMINWVYNCSSFCSNVPVPPCRQPGYQDPRNCNSCKCPRIFGGQYCEQLPTGSAPNCNGAVLQATSTSWTTLHGVAGDPNSYEPETDTSDCYWHITAPAGRRIQLRLITPPSNCMEGCPWQSIEINLGQFDLYGMIMCCQSAVGQTYTSLSNLVAIRGAIRYNQLTFGLDYRLV